MWHKKTTLKSMGEAKFANSSTNFDVVPNILLCPPGNGLAKFGWYRFGCYGSEQA